MKPPYHAESYRQGFEAGLAKALWFAEHCADDLEWCGDNRIKYQVLRDFVALCKEVAAGGWGLWS